MGLHTYNWSDSLRRDGKGFRPINGFIAEFLLREKQYEIMIADMKKDRCYVFIDGKEYFILEVLQAEPIVNFFDAEKNYHCLITLKDIQMD